MKSAKQIVFIAIGVAMILLAVGLIAMKKGRDSDGGTIGGESGTRTFPGTVKDLVFEVGASTIDVMIGDTEEYILSYEGLKYGTISDRYEDGVLRITYRQKDNWPSKLMYDNDIDKQKITLTVPKDAVLDSALFEFGAAEIGMEGITAKELYVTVGAGQLNAYNLTATELAKFNAGAGAFYADEVVLTNAELMCGVGQMNLSGIFTGDTTVDCGVGSMELDVDGAQEEYRGDLNCGLGEIRFGDIEIEGSGQKSYGTSSATSRMDIKCGIGEVDVRFED